MTNFRLILQNIIVAMDSPPFVKLWINDYNSKVLPSVFLHFHVDGTDINNFTFGKSNE